MTFSGPVGRAVPGWFTRQLVWSALLICPAVAVAQQDYECFVERLESPSPDTLLALIQTRKAYVGQKFTVDRATGRMSGALRNSFDAKPQVIDQGSKDSGFKVVTTEKAHVGSIVFTLVINEFVSASGKPFVFLRDTDVFFGSCVHV